MKRRITLAVVLVTVAAVVLTGVGTALLSWRHVRSEARRQLADEASAIVPFVTGAVAEPALGRASGGTELTRRVLVARRALRLVDASVLVVDATGTVTRGTVPDGVDPAVVSTAAAEGASVSGMHGQLAWAVAVSQPRAGGRRIAVVLTRQVPLFAGVLRWVLLSGVVAVALAIVAAALVARRIADPLYQVEEATHRIAAGDLTARVGDLRSDPGVELTRLAASVDTMAASIEEGRRAQRDFLMSISHDLRTPLTSMHGYAEAIVDGAAPDPVEAAGVILSQSVRLERLVADLLALARLESHQFTLHEEPIDVAAVARSSVAGFAHAAVAAGVALDLEVSVPQAVVVADGDRLAQVIANLVENALRFASARVRVAVDAVAPNVRLTVGDDGPGIDPGDFPHVFDRLFVSRTVPPRTGPGSTGSVPSGSVPTGSGLGLAICRELVHAMSGTIEATAGRDGIGTQIVVTLAATPALRE